MGGEGHAAVGGDVQGDFHLVWMCVSRLDVRLKRGGNIPPPKGVPGCGAFKMAKPGV